MRGGGGLIILKMIEGEEGETKKEGRWQKKSEMQKKRKEKKNLTNFYYLLICMYSIFLTSFSSPLLLPFFFPTPSSHIFFEKCQLH